MKMSFIVHARTACSRDTGPANASSPPAELTLTHSEPDRAVMGLRVERRQYNSRLLVHFRAACNAPAYTPVPNAWVLHVLRRAPHHRQRLCGCVSGTLAARHQTASCSARHCSLCTCARHPVQRSHHVPMRWVARPYIELVDAALWQTLLARPLQATHYRFRRCAPQRCRLH